MGRFWALKEVLFLANAVSLPSTTAKPDVVAESTVPTKPCNSMGSFRFKQFEVVQDHSAMKVNTDAVLLGAWVRIPGTSNVGNVGNVGNVADASDVGNVVDTADVGSVGNTTYMDNADSAGNTVGDSATDSDPETVRVLDIGTGTGVIALMVGQRIATNAEVASGAEVGSGAEVASGAKVGSGAEVASGAGEIHAVEIDSGACKDAAANFNSAPWVSISFHLHEKSLQEFAAENCNPNPAKFNLIVSNPPYFISSLKNDSAAKTMARHTDTLSQRELLFHSTTLLAEGGIFAVILPVTEGEELLHKVEFMARSAIAADRTAAEVGAAAYTATSSQLALFPSRICYVHTVERKPAKRLMLEFIKCHPSSRPILQREQLVMMSNGQNTPKYTALVGNFYL